MVLKTRSTTKSTRLCFNLQRKLQRRSQENDMKSGRRFWFLTSVFFLASIRPLFAQNAPPLDLDAYVVRVLKTFDVPGLSVAIVKDGKVLMAKG